MISANDLREVKFQHEDDGFNIAEVESVIEQASDTIEAYANENKELYRKLEALASKIEEYRRDEDSIKSALITAQKMSDTIEADAKEKANKLIADSEAKSAETVSKANEQAEQTISEARNYATGLIKNKTDEANGIIAAAEKKANDAINSSKIVAQDILDQAKAISDDLIATSKEEKEAYELLNAALKKDAAEFITGLKELYTSQLNALNGAKIDMTQTADKTEVEDIENHVSSLLNEIDEMEDAIPGEITLEAVEVPEVEEEPAFEPEEEENDAEQLTLTEDGPEDAKAAVEAFSNDEITPVDSSQHIIPEITEEPEMEDVSSDDEQPFESYFNLKKEDAHLDKTQTISLVPPDDYDDGEDDEPRHKAFFKKKK